MMTNPPSVRSFAAAWLARVPRPRGALRGFALTGVAWLLTQVALAQPPPPISPDRLFAGNIAAGMQLDKFLTLARAQFRLADVDGDGEISLADLDRNKAMTAATARAAVIAEYLRYDLDGDGVITRDEIASVETYAAQRGFTTRDTDIALRQRVEERVALRMRADLNGDGRIEWSELMAYVERTTPVGAAPLEPIIRSLLSFDEDGDGRTSLVEFEHGIERLFRSIDTDGDGVISQEEFKDYRLRIGQPLPPYPPPYAQPSPRPYEQPRQEFQAAQEARHERECAMPPVVNDLKVVLVGIYKGEGLSNVSVGSQPDTTTAHIDIEPGPEALYLVLISFDPVIWQIHGEVGRVAKAVVASIRSIEGSGGALAGVTGLRREAVTFLPRGDCLRGFTQTGTVEAALAKGVVKGRIGHEVDVTVASQAVWALSLPSGKMQAPPRAGWPRDQFAMLRSELDRLYPGGVVSLDAKAVISRVPVERYEVLPGKAGLLQLLESGALELNRRGEYIVRAKIRFPPGLQRVPAARFLVPKGVPIPDGEPSDACVVSEDAGAALGNDINCPR
jgi:Ca2+-binding EF-hand superfamily protein